MSYEFRKDNLLNLLKKPDDTESDSDTSTSLSECSEETDSETDEEIAESVYQKNVNENKAKLKKTKSTQNEIDKYKKKLGLSMPHSTNSTPRKTDSTQILMDFEDHPDQIIRNPVDIEQDMEIFKQLTYPSLVADGLEKLQRNEEMDQYNDENEFEKITKSRIEDTVNNLSFSIKRQKQVSLIKKLKNDLQFDYKQSLKKKKANLYTDLKRLASMQIFSLRWRNIILMDPNVEMPFIYLQSVQTGGVGAVKHDFYSNIQMLEPYGMTAQTIYEAFDCCKYRAFFSGKVPEKKKDTDENIIQTMIEERKMDNKMTEAYYQGGISGGSIDHLLKKNVRKPDHYYTEKDRIQHLKTAQKRASQHEKPIDFFDPKKRPIDEKTKLEKKKDNVLKIEFQINRKIDDFQDDPEDSENELEESESTSEKVGRYDRYLNGFTQSMLDSLVQNCQFINEQSIEAIARKSTEISAWIENNLCIDICIFPGKRDATSESIERQLLFVFNVCSQNPYTFLLHNLATSERNELLRNQERNTVPTKSS